ncbi:Ankyrin repeat [Faustovirus ST1]|nr:Ankyrin repeat [Faustovirus ST1]
MAFKPFNKLNLKTVIVDQKADNRRYLENVSDLSLAYNYAIDPANDYKCNVVMKHKAADYTHCITDNVDKCREYYLDGIKQGELVISENILDHVVCHDAHKCLLLLTEIGIMPTERSLELSAIYGHLDTLIAIIALGVGVTEDIADISAQHGRVDILKYIYHTFRIIPTTYGLINGILNKHCSVVDFICKLLRKYGSNRINSGLNAKSQKRSITPISPRTFRNGPATAASHQANSLVLNLTYLSSTETTGEDLSDDQFDTPRTIRSLSPVSVGSIGSIGSISNLSSWSLGSSGMTESPFSSPFASPRDHLFNDRVLQTPSPRGRSNSWTSNYSDTLTPKTSPRHVVISSKRSPRRSSKLMAKPTSRPKVNLESLNCRVECIEAACQTGCLHCFDKVMKYNSEYTAPKHIVMLTKSLSIATYRGWLEICKKLVKIGVELTKQVFIAAAKSGNYELFVWLHEAGCPWSYEVYDTAMTYGWTKLGLYALENGCGS